MQCKPDYATIDTHGNPINTTLDRADLQWLFEEVCARDECKGSRGGWANLYDPGCGGCCDAWNKAVAELEQERAAERAQEEAVQQNR